MTYDVTACEWFTQVCRAGRNHGPRLLVEWWEEGVLTTEELRGLLPHVWSMAEWPEQHLSRRDWLAMFSEAGFASDSGHEAPTEPLTIFRGCSYERRRGMSWTTDLEQAEWFAARLVWVAAGNVYEATVPPVAVLALVGGRSEAEVVVNPNRLRGRAAPKLGAAGVDLDVDKIHERHRALKDEELRGML